MVITVISPNLPASLENKFRINTNKLKIIIIEEGDHFILYF